MVMILEDNLNDLISKLSITLKDHFFTYKYDSLLQLHIVYSTTLSTITSIIERLAKDSSTVNKDVDKAVKTKNKDPKEPDPDDNKEESESDEEVE